jgi:hypothetical protein
MKLRLKHFLQFTSLLLYLFILSCEDVELALPGNTQDLKASPPKGSMAWSVTTTIIDDNVVGQLPEDLDGTNTTLGAIEVDDRNPDDEIKLVTIETQKINGYDGSSRELFDVIKDSLGTWKVVLKPSANIDYETIHSQNGSSTLSEIVMEITDDSPSGETGILTASVLITNVNESPAWGNTSIGTTADEGILFQSPEITWSDVDQGGSHTLSPDPSNDLPGWLTIDVNKLTGTPSTADVNPSASFTLILKDQGDLQITKSFTINVRGNEAPSFTGSSGQTWEEEINKSWTISFTDPNSVDNSTLTAEASSSLDSYGLTFQQNGMNGTVSGTLPHSYVDQDVTFQITLNDNRNGNPLDTTKTFTIAVNPNDAPNFSNTNLIMESINHGCQYYYDVNWFDPDGDNVVLTYDKDVDWLTINTLSGVMSGTPAESDTSSSGTVSLTITDNRPNVPRDTTYTFSIEVGENFPPEFTNLESVDTIATVGAEYSHEFAINDDNSDALTFTVPIIPDWLTVNFSQYKIYGTPPDSTYIGTHNVRVEAADCGTSTSFNFSIEVSE